MNRTISLWKTCRVLANETRLTLLRDLMSGTELCVIDIARAKDLTEVVASQHLRLLNDYGFLQVKRKSKWVFYRAESVSKEAYVDYFFKPLKKKLLSEPNSIEEIIHLFTAFTHPRRIEIAKALLQRNQIREELICNCNISGQAIHRHLHKLMAREFIVQKNKVFQIIRYNRGLRKALLEACEAAEISHTS